MLGTTNIKFVDAQQAKLAYQYKNTKGKLYKTNAAIWFNKICRQPLRRIKAQLLHLVGLISHTIKHDARNHKY